MGSVFDNINPEDIANRINSQEHTPKEPESLKVEAPPRDADVELLGKLGIDSTNVVDWFEGDYGMGKPITQDEVEKLAKEFNTTKYNIENLISLQRGTLSDEDKRDLSSKFGAKLDWIQGQIYGALGDIPYLISKKVEGLVDEKAEQKYDAIAELVERRKSKASMAADVGVEMLLPGGATSKFLTSGGKIARTAKAVGSSSAVGALMGVGGSRRGKEVEGAKMGAVAGPLLAFGIPGMVKLVSKVGALAINPILRRKAVADLTSAAEKRMAETRHANDVMYEIARGREPEDWNTKELQNQLKITKKEIDKVINEEELSGSAEEITEEAIKIIVTDKARSETIQFATEWIPSVTRLNEKITKSGIDLEKAIENGEVDILSTFVKDFKFPAHVEEDILKTLKGQLDEGTKAHFVDKIARSLRKQGRDRDVVKSLDGLYERLNEVERIEGRDLRKLWDLFRFGTEANKEASRLSSKLGRDAIRMGGVRGGLHMIGDFLSATQHRLEIIDHKLGTDLGYHFMKVNNRLNSAKVDSDELIGEYLGKFSRLLRSETRGRKDWDENKFYDFIENPDKVTDAPMYYQKLRKLHTETYSNLLDELLARGLEIPKRKDYIPHRLKSRREIRTILWDGLDSLEKLVEKPDSKSEFGKLLRNDKESRNYISAVMTLANSKKGRPETLDQLKKLVDQVQSDPDLSSIITRINSSSIKRKGQIPRLIRETNPNKLMESWIRENIRHIHTREPLRELLKWVNPLEKMGADKEADYLRFVLNRASGFSKGPWEKYVSDHASKVYRDLVDKTMSPGTLREMVKETPVAFSHFFNMAYSGLLSNPASSIRNLEQPFVLTSEEISPFYGKELYFRSIIPSIFEIGSNEARSVLSKSKLVKSREQLGIAKSLIYKLEKEGRIPKSVKLESIDVGDKPSTVKDMVEFVNRNLLYTFGLADKTNRVTTVIMARNLTLDAMSGREAALKSLSNIGSVSLKKKMAKNVSAKDWEAVEEDLADFLLQRTQFVYNKNNQSDFANAVGPIFSMFSKWPTEIMGDVMAKGAKGEAEKAVQKYLGPLAYLYTIDALVAGNKRTFNKREKGVYPGKQGFTGHAPILNISRFLVDDRGKISLLSTPHMQASASLIYGLLGDNKATTRFIRDQVPTYIGVRAAVNMMDKYPELLGYKAVGVGDWWQKKAKKLSRWHKRNWPKVEKNYEKILNLD